MSFPRTMSPWGWKLLLAVGLGAVVLWVLHAYQTTALWDEGEGPVSSGTVSGQVGEPVFTEMRGDRLLKSLAAREFVLNRRSMLAFQSRMAWEARFRDVRLYLYRYTIDPETSQTPLTHEVGGMLKGVMPGGKGQIEKGSPWSRVTRVILEPVYLEVLLDQVPVLKLQAASADVGKDTGRIHFHHVRLENPVANQRIFSESVYWSDESRSFEIPGVYQAESPKGRATARALRVEMDFSLAAMP
ncbi:MAG: hypothetical protein HQL95_01415 [Magnetococcales bacterium]|nr:hypothetical protein [Magnetococcales bacterium]